MSKQTKAALVIFDLDFTLTKRGSWGRFVLQIVGLRFHKWVPLLLQAGWAQFQYKCGKAERITVKQAMMRNSMVGKSYEEMRAQARRFVQKEVRTGLRAGARRALKVHKRNRDEIMIASAAVDILVSEFAEALGIEHFVATEMGWTESGYLSFQFASQNCYGEQKLRRIVNYLQDKPHLRPEKGNIIVYSDSYSDLPMFEWADIKIAVNPDRTLRRLAKNQDICIVHW